MKKLAVVLIVVLLLAGVLLQWGLDRTPAGTDADEESIFPSSASLLDLLGGARQYLAYVLYIKVDKIHHTYYGSLAAEGELVPYFIIVTSLDPNYISAYYVGSGIMDEYGEREEAIRFNLQGLEANPESADLYFSLAALYVEDERYEEAKEALLKGLEYEPEIVGRGTLMSALSDVYAALGEAELSSRYLLEHAIYNQARLVTQELSHDERKTLVLLINNELNVVLQDGLPGDTEEGGREERAQQGG